MGTIVCPDVASQLPAIPAAAQAEVSRNLTLLQTQIGEAQRRLETTVGQGGPDFVQNAILGPLADKRTATIDRIAIAIGRHTTKPQLDEATLSTCSVQDAGAVDPPATDAPTSDAPATDAPSAPADPAPSQTPSTTDPTAAVGTITCRDVASQLPAIPAAAQAEVTRNLALLQTQINEAQRRLETTVGQGGPDFVQNAILGPLADKRTATINRIATAIGRVAAKPQLDTATLSTCSVR